MSVFNKLLVYFVGIALVSLVVTGISSFTSSYLKSDLEQIVTKTLPGLNELYQLSEHITRLTTDLSSISQLQKHADYLNIKRNIDREQQIIKKQFSHIFEQTINDNNSMQLTNNLNSIFSNLKEELSYIEKLIKNKTAFREKQTNALALAATIQSELKRIRIVAADHFLKQSQITEEFITEKTDWRGTSRNYQVLMDDNFDMAENSFELHFRAHTLSNLIRQIGETNSVAFVHQLNQQYNLNIQTISRLALTLELQERQMLGQYLQQVQLNMAGANNIFQLKQQQFKIEQSIQEYKQENQKLRNKIAYAVDNLIQNNRAKISGQVRKTEFISDIGVWANIIMGAACLLAALLITRYFVYGNIISRLKLLTETTRKLASGQLDVDVQVKGHDELSQMAESIQVFKENAIALENHRALLEERVAERTSKLTHEADEHKQTTAALQKSETKFRNLYEFSRDAVLILGHEQIIDCNREALKMFGVQHRDEIAGLSISTLFPSTQPNGSPSLQGFQDFMNQAFAGKGHLFEWVYNKKKGECFFSETLFSVTEFADQLVVQAVVRDISKRKQMEGDLLDAKQTAEKAAKVKGDFLANMSHEIRTPLNAIIGITHLLESTKLTLKQEDYLHKMQSSSRILLSIINDILDYSKIEASALNLEQTEFLLEDILRDVGDVNANRARDKGLELLYSCDTSLDCYLKGDPLRLVQILNNLISNAIKFTDSGSVVLKAEVEDRGEEQITVCFSVKDTGVGLDKGQQENLFAAFSQADTSVTRKHGGTGLGLSISKRLIELMGGHMWVDSEVGKGSQFSFTVQLGLACNKRKDGELNPEQFRNLRVLIAARNPELGLILEKILEKSCIEIKQVNAIADALENIQGSGQQYDLIMLDHRLIDNQDDEIIRQLKMSATHIPTAKTIMISVFGQDHAENQADSVLFDAFLYKPFSPSDVFDAIAVAMGSSRIVQKSMKGTHIPDRNDMKKLQGARILLVEDNEINQEIATEMLSLAGVQVVVANNGQEAIDILDNTAVDLVLMDIQMPVMDGYEATQKLREDDKFADLPILAMTANVMEEDRRKAHETGMNGHIAKPINPKELFQIIGNWVTIDPIKTTKDLMDLDEGNDTDWSIPASEDLDVKAGLMRTSNNRQLYVKLLGKFVANHSDGVSQLNKALQTGDKDLAERRAHTLKGVAGNIGAVKVQKAAAAIESAIRTENKTALNNGLSTLSEALPPLVNHITKAVSLEKSGHPAKQADSMDADRVMSTLQEIRQLLSEGDIAAGDYLTPLRNYCGHNQVAEHINSLAELIDQYDFDEALEQISILEAAFEKLPTQLERTI